MPSSRTRPGYRSGTLPAALTFALGLAAAPAVASATPDAYADEQQDAICTSEAHPELAERLGEEIQDQADQRDGRVAVGVSAHDGDLVCGLDPAAEFDAASVGKVVILGALLRTAMDEDRELTEREDELATDMITVSGNDSTVELRNLLGAERIQGFLDLVGMDDTILHPDGSVGLMKINTADQLSLLEVLRTENDVLGADQREYARGLMGDVIDEQRWGVPVGAPDDAGVYLKNGWLPYPDTDVWRVNSVGGFQDTPIGDYDLVVLTDDNPGMQHGVDTIEAVAVAAHAVLTGEDAPERAPLTELPEIVSDGSDRA